MHNRTDTTKENMMASATETISQAVSAMAVLAGKYLTFKLGAEEYGLEILKVQEIIKMMDITTVPRTPAFVKGVINLRGKVIPVVDLRLKFEMEGKEDTDMTCIIVLQVARADATVTMGIVVDEVSEVLDIAGEEIEPSPSMGSTVESQFILGMAKSKGAVKILLDADKVLSAGDMEIVTETAA
jgi:purine-binding chemotaxis protein CheW